MQPTKPTECFEPKNHDTFAIFPAEGREILVLIPEAAQPLDCWPLLGDVGTTAAVTVQPLRPQVANTLQL